MKLTVKGDAVRFEVHARPRAKRSRLMGIRDGRLAVSLAAPPVARARNMKVGELVFDTDAGPRACAIDDGGDVSESGNVTVDMGIVRDLGHRELVVDSERVGVWLADAGNPHTVLFGEASRER